jgi:hypothetical protein
MNVLNFGSGLSEKNIPTLSGNDPFSCCWLIMTALADGE